MSDLKYNLVSCGSTSIHHIPLEVIPLIHWKALWYSVHIFHSFSFELFCCLPRAPIHKYNITYGNTLMLSIKDSASFSLLQNTTPLNTMLYCFPEFQLQLECFVLRGATWWIRLIIMECQKVKKRQQRKWLSS